MAAAPSHLGTEGRAQATQHNPVSSHGDVAALHVLSAALAACDLLLAPGGATALLALLQYGDLRVLGLIAIEQAVEVWAPASQRWHGWSCRVGCPRVYGGVRSCNA
jgi:hypothetical protein